MLMYVVSLDQQSVCSGLFCALLDMIRFFLAIAVFLC